MKGVCKNYIWQSLTQNIMQSFKVKTYLKLPDSNFSKASSKFAAEYLSFERQSCPSDLQKIIPTLVSIYHIL